MTCKDCHHHLHNYHDKYVCTNKNSDCYGLNTDDDDSCALCETDWIRVEDRMPDELLEVLVCTEDGYTVGYHVCGRWVLLAYHSPVTHWQSLPEPPRQDELPMPESIKKDIYDAIARGENYDGKRVSIHHSDVGYPDKTKDE